MAPTLDLKFNPPTQIQIELLNPPTAHNVVIVGIISALAVFLSALLAAKYQERMAKSRISADRAKGVDDAILKLIAKLLVWPMETMNDTALDNKLAVLSVLLPSSSSTARTLRQIAREPNRRTEDDFLAWQRELGEAATRYYDSIYEDALRN
jgi:hypothetical protein